MRVLNRYEYDSVNTESIFTVGEHGTLSWHGQVLGGSDGPDTTKDRIVLILISIILIGVSGICAGLTLGLLSLDKMDIEVMKLSGSEHKKKMVKKVEHLVERPHRVLVTLLVMNSACMEALPIFLDRLLNPFAAIVISVTAILLFGEIIPQAVCKKFGLEIGAYLSWLVVVMMWITFPVSYPIGKLLDLVLGHPTALFRRHDIDAIVQYHANLPEDERKDDTGLTRQEADIIHGALALDQGTIGDAMTSRPEVFELSSEWFYDEKLELRIVKEGRSRLPVCMPDGGYKLLLVKELLLLPKNIFEKKKKIKDIPELVGLFRDVRAYKASEKKFTVLRDMMKSRTHLALVVGDAGSPTKMVKNKSIAPQNDDDIEIPLIPDQYDGDDVREDGPADGAVGGSHDLQHNDAESCQASSDGFLVGIITLEDILEDLLRQEIIDETDIYEDNERRKRVQDRFSQYKEDLINRRAAAWSEAE